MPFQSHELPLNIPQKQELESYLRRPGLSASIALRVRIVLMLADGARYSEIRQQLQTSAPTISLWKSRYHAAGLVGLTTLHPGQQASVLTPELRARILQRTMETPAGGASRWSLRTMAKAVGVSKDLVRTVWLDAGMRTQRPTQTGREAGPDLPGYAMDVVGVQLTPSQHVAVFADARYSRGRTAAGSRQGSLGVIALYAALNAQTCDMGSPVEFRSFLSEVVASQPGDRAIYCVVDRVSTQQRAVLRGLSEGNPNMRFQVTSQYISWVRRIRLILNALPWPAAVEELAPSVADLSKEVLYLIQRYSKIGKPFRWWLVGR